MRIGLDLEVKVLLASPCDSDAASLRRILGHTAWSLQVVKTITEAVATIKTHPISVVFCNDRLPDGTWRDLVQQVEMTPERPNVIVTCQLPEDQLWLDVLDGGGYDLVSKPFKSDDVFRSISLAWLNWKQKMRARLRAHAAGAQTASNAAEHLLHT